MDAPLAYIPMDRRQIMAAEQNLPDRTQGAGLFIDISGFTKLTDDLVTQLGDRRGADELIDVLNKVYGALIAEVHRYGGSVVGFSGDAITCWFDHLPSAENSGPANVLQTITLRATACALSSQQVMRKFTAVKTPSGITMSLGIKAAVSAGPARRFLVGNPAVQYIDVVAGATLDRMAEAEGYAQKGEVVLDPKAASILAECLIISEWRNGSTNKNGPNFAVVSGLTCPIEETPWRVPPFVNAAEDSVSNVLSEEQIRPWLLPLIYERLQTGYDQFLAELRRAIPLFVLFEGIDYDHDDDAGTKLDAYVSWVQDVLTHYGGYLIQLTTGDKGAYLYACFGAPIAHDDDARRAIAAAIVLRSPPTTLNFITNIRIGLSQGRMRAGACGSPTRRTYGVLGDEVNMAARLMEKAVAGQILISQRVAEAIAERYHLHPLEPITVKGRQTPLSVFAVLDEQVPSLSPSRPPPKIGPTRELVGRESEQSLLRDRLLALADQSQGGVIIIEGEAGIGKSQLVANVFASTPLQTVISLVGTGQAIEKSTPYHAWRPIFRQLFRLDELPEDLDQRRTHVLTHPLITAQPELAHLAPLLNAVLPIDLPDNEFTSQMVGQVRANNTRELLIHLLQGVTQYAPLALILEDAHWLDSTSWALARLTSRDVKPVLLVIVVRPLTDPPPADYQRLLMESNIQRLQLDTLSPPDTIQLVCKRLGVKALPEPVATLIQKKAEGHPFFSEELAYTLQEIGLIAVQDGVCQIVSSAGNVDTISLPDTIEGIITSRIDNLAPSQQLTLKIASAIGRAFLFSTLYDIHPIKTERSHLAEYLTALEQLDITLLETTDPDLSYSFKHSITQEVTYNLMVFDQRQRLHQAIAEWYETRYAGDLAPWHALLAHHWRRADKPIKALEYFEKAGEQASRNGAYREAVTFFQEVLTLAEPFQTTPNEMSTINSPLNISLEHFARWQRRLGDAYLGLGQLVKSRACFERALLILGQPVPQTAMKAIMSATVQGTRQISYWFISGLKRRLAKLWRPKLVAGQPSSPTKRLWLEAAQTYEQLAEIYYYANQTMLSINASLYALNLAEKGGSAPELARMYANMCLIVGLIPIHRLAKSYDHRARTSAQKINQLSLLAYVLTRTGMYDLVTCQWAKATEALEQAIKLAENLKDWRRMGEGLILLAFVNYGQGKFTRSRELFETLYTLGEQTGNIQHQTWGLNGQAIYFWQKGRPEHAITVLEKAFPLFETNFDRVAEIISYEILALARLRLGQQEAAQQANKMASNLIAQTAPTPLSAFADYIGIAMVYLTLWEASQDRPLAEQKTFAKLAQGACRVLRVYVYLFPIGQPRLWLTLGHYYWLSGRPAKAHKAWQKSLALAQQRVMPYEEGLAHYETGRHLDINDPRRCIHLSRACEIFNQLEAPYDHHLAQKALESS